MLSKKATVFSSALIIFIAISSFSVYGLGYRSPTTTTSTTTTYTYHPITVLEIIAAYYTNLDTDGLTDDIFTNFLYCSPNGDWAYLQGKIYMYLTLPSGLTYYTSVRYQGIVDEVSIIMEWYNAATESGWYLFEVYISAYGFDSDGNYINTIYYSSMWFDPPDVGNPGASPFGIIFIA
jgi:hypothetical protein